MIAFTQIGEHVDEISRWNPSTATGTFIYVDVGSIDRDAKVIAEPETIPTHTAPSRARQILKAGDVLVSTVRPNLNAVAYVQPDLDGATASTGFCVLRARDQLDGRYLFHWVRTPRFIGEMVKLSTGASYPAVTDRIVKQSLIPLPPIEEQRRIATVLNAADALRAKRSQTIEKLDTLTQAIFIDMFGDPRVGTPGMHEPLGDHVDLYSGSTLPNGTPFKGQSEGYFLVKVSDLALPANGKFIVRTHSWSSKPGPAASTCPAGSIVIPKRGGAISTNRKRITTRPSILDPNLMGISPRLESLNLEFLYAWFQLLDLSSIQSGSSVPQLNKKDLNPIELPIPDLAKQIEFASTIDRVDGQRESVQTHSTHLDTLFTSLQQAAFRGEL